jgi:hypothetical protein
MKDYKRYLNCSSMKLLLLFTTTLAALKNNMPTSAQENVKPTAQIDVASTFKAIFASLNRTGES